MPRCASALLFVLLFAMPGWADAPPSRYDVNVLTQDDIGLYLAIMRAAVDHTQHLPPADKEAIDFVRKNRNNSNPANVAMPSLPSDRMPSEAEMDAFKKALAEQSGRAQKVSGYYSRAAALSQYDEEIARQRNVLARYDGIKGAVTSVVGIYAAHASCGGSDCGPGTRPTAAQLALWKKEADVQKANEALLKPHEPEISRLQRVLASMTGG